MLKFYEIWRPIGNLLKLDKKRRLLVYAKFRDYYVITYRIIKGNAGFFKGGYGYICSPGCGITGSTQKYFNGSGCWLAWFLFVIVLLAVFNAAKRFCAAQFISRKTAAVCRSSSSRRVFTGAVGCGGGILLQFRFVLIRITITISNFNTSIIIL